MNIFKKKYFCTQVKEIKEGIDRLVEDKQEKEDLDTLREECLVPFISHTAVKASMLDPELRSKCKKLVRLTVRNTKGLHAINFLDALLSPFIKGKVYYTEADAVLDEGPHYYMGEEVYHLVPEFTAFFYDCLNSHIARQNDPTQIQDKEDQRITDQESIRRQFKRDFANARNLWKEDLLPDIRKRADDSLDSQNYYWDMVYKDAKRTLKELYDSPPPDLNDEPALDAYITEHMNVIEVRYAMKEKSSVKGIQKRKHNKFSSKAAGEEKARKEAEKKSKKAQEILAGLGSRLGAQPGASQVGLHQGAPQVHRNLPQHAAHTPPGGGGAGTPSGTLPGGGGAGTPSGTPPGGGGAGTPSGAPP